jgi:hypothetical protein
MDLLVLCRCGHPTTLHSENGCRAGRYQPCPCLFDAYGAMEAAIAEASSPNWREPVNPMPAQSA